MKRSIGIILLTMILLGSIVYGFEKPDAKTIWTDATPGNRLEPGGSKKNTGYVAGERPGFKTWNWLIYNLGLWTNYLEDVTDTLKTSSTTSDGHIGQTGDIGIGTSTPTAKVHIVSTGTGAAYQIDTTQQDKAIYVSSSGVVEIASMTVVKQTVDNLTINNEIANLAVSSGVITNLTATNIKNTQLDSDNSAIDVMTSTQVTITPGGAVVALTIAQHNEAVGLVIDTESTNHWAEDIACRYGIRVVGDISNGRALDIQRDLNEGGNKSLVLLTEEHASGTQAVLEIDNDGSGENIKFTHAVTRYLSLPGSVFIGIEADWDTNVDNFYTEVDGGRGTNQLAATREFIQEVCLPNSALITAVRMYYYQSDNTATVALKSYRMDFAGNTVLLATCNDQNIATAYGTNDDTSIENGAGEATVDNTQYAYYLVAEITNNAAMDDVYLMGARVTYTITEPLP